MKYKKNYIENFIFRLDLRKNTQETIEKILRELKSTFQGKLDILKSRDVITKSIELNETERNFKIEDDDKVTEYRLSNNDDTEFITIANEYICYENTNYDNFEKARENIKQMIDSVVRASNIKICNRIGMRFINNIILPSETKEQILDWNGYIQKELLSNIDFFEKKNNREILQSMSVIDINSKKDSNLYYSLQFGLYNSRIPGQMLDKQYILDIDGKTKTVEELEDIDNKIDTMHNEIEEIFEEIIDEEMRKDMGEICSEP